MGWVFITDGLCLLRGTSLFCSWKLRKVTFGLYVVHELKSTFRRSGGILEKLEEMLSTGFHHWSAEVEGPDLEHTSEE